MVAANVVAVHAYNHKHCNIVPNNRDPMAPAAVIEVVPVLDLQPHLVDAEVVIEALMAVLVDVHEDVVVEAAQNMVEVVVDHASYGEVPLMADYSIYYLLVYYHRYLVVFVDILFANVQVDHI